MFERLHSIDLVKDGWRATNHRKMHLLQMTRWLDLRERMESFELYREWRDGEEEVGDGRGGEEVTVGKRTKTRRAWNAPDPAEENFDSLLCYSVGCGMQRWPLYEAVYCKASGWTPETFGGLQHSTPNTLYFAHSLYLTVPPGRERYIQLFYKSKTRFPDVIRGPTKDPSGLISPRSQ